MKPITRNEKYELNVVIEKAGDDLFFVREEQYYFYSDVWAARNAYENFFSKGPYDWEEVEPDYCDKHISMMGNDDGMHVIETYIYSFTNLGDAESKKALLLNQYASIEK